MEAYPISGSRCSKSHLTALPGLSCWRQDLDNAFAEALGGHFKQRNQVQTLSNRGLLKFAKVRNSSRFTLHSK
jgi:hypothetical protein